TTSGASGTRPLAASETAIELPFRMQLSPNQQARFAHADRPATVRGRSELWTTRMGVGTARGSLANLDAPRLRTMRALSILGPARDPLGASSPLTSLTRTQILQSMSDPHNVIQVDQLALSALGAWFD